MYGVLIGGILIAYILDWFATPAAPDCGTNENDHYLGSERCNNTLTRDHARNMHILTSTEPLTFHFCYKNTALMLHISCATPTRLKVYRTR